MDVMNRRTRRAGLVYLALVGVAPVRLMLIPGRLFVRGDAAATAANIGAHATLFRVGLVADLLAALLLLAVALALYRLFEHVDRDQARLLVILGGFMPVPIYFLNVLNDAAVLHLATAAAPLGAGAVGQRTSLMQLFLDLHGDGVLVNEVFWGLWLLPFGYLVNKSGAFPRVLGWLLYVNGAAYLALSATGLLFPDAEPRVSAALYPATLGEVVVMLWFLVVGARPPRVPPVRPSASSFPGGSRDPEAQERPVPAVLQEARPQDRQAPEPRDLRDPRGGRATRA